MAQASTPRISPEEFSPQTNIEITPNPVGEPPARTVPLTPEERQHREALIRQGLATLDADHDGNVSQGELRGRGAGLDNFMQIVNDVQNEIEARGRNNPGTPLRGLTMNDTSLFDRDLLIDNLYVSPSTGGFSRSEIDRMVREALPGGVATITVADQCDTFDVGCMRVGTNMVIISPRRSGPDL